MEVTVNASFCFWETLTAFCALPALITTEAERSSGVSFSIVVMVILALPAGPLVGETEHQLSARELITDTVQGADELNEIVLLPPSAEKSDVEVGNVMFGCEGVGAGSSNSSPPPEQAVTIVIKNDSSHQ